ncbi:serine/threonine-protein kinase ATM [Striga asiatica]|uniref:non-specific serine/threonine protein kinase n=1 Tax=Striga asiatica TaxID=4170 RepID=A0A5A7RM36_STRAF|nr:serine/threonine-protein kinase ATM [Striga asiatica]
MEDRDNFLCTALGGYKRCLIIGEKYDVHVVFRLVSLWFSLSSRQIVVDSMISTIKEFALFSLVKKMALDHPYHTIFQLLALANGDRIKDKQRSRNSFVVDVDKKIAAEDLLKELSSYHGAIIRQMKQMVEVYIKLAEMETKREDTNKRVNLPRDIRSVRELELTCCGLSFLNAYSWLFSIMNGINAPKVVECFGSDGNRYRQLAKSGNDDLRQDAVMEQFFGLVNTFLQNNRDTWRRRLKIRTYKVDGMGVTGVEGVFRRCCEETLSVMRTNKEALLTIIEVFIHDPLYKWALSPLKAMRRQKDAYDDLVVSYENTGEEVYEGNKDATRALLRIKQKLDGYEDGEMRSVHGQVQQLIQDAIDPDRLCHMFPGWGAWL